MVKVFTVEMIEHSAHSTPNVTAHADLPNGALVGLTYTGTAQTTKAPATGEELYIVLNTQEGDKEYDLTYTIAQGEYVNLFKLSNWVGKELAVTKENIVGTFANIAVGDTLTFDATTFKFKEDTATSGDVAFEVLAITPIGVRVLIKIAA
ncbi:MAG: hypothetical protein BWY47_00584 [Bacteroidetes bacterium ADurb.Bin302]|nr:MAG: hypothetical protein BWY47_00584 [Bacteroidetes bacterium ADurb.Bin302]